VRAKDGLIKMLGLCVVAGVLVAGVVFPLVGGLGVLTNQAGARINDLSVELAKVPPPAVTKILDNQGNLIARIFEQYRIPVNADKIAPTMKAAIVAVEDQRFYQHSGVDPRGIARAAFHDIGGGATQGASTITQQYVKN
jgi:membrane peptidoglycan carboxypeptidase